MDEVSPAGYSPQEWGKWAPSTKIGDSLIEVTHTEEEPPQAISVLARPVIGHDDSGAFIHCLLRDQKVPNVFVEPSTKAYWSSRRRGPGREYFFEGHPRLTLAVLHALETRKPIDRTRALLYLFVTPSGYDPEPGEGVAPLIHDHEGFVKVAEKWIARFAQSKKGLKELNSARSMIEKAKRYNESLTQFDALRVPETALAKPTQSAVLLAIKMAAKGVNGIPLLGEVRNAFDDILIAQQSEYKKPLVPQRSSHVAPSDKPNLLRSKGFDTGVKQLGFSWLPKSWE